VSKNKDEFEAIKNQTGWDTVPQIFIGDKFIGGCDDLLALDSKGELDKLLR
jgi:glutaredoxin 3